jgi:hypothetical protein
MQINEEALLWNLEHCYFSTVNASYSCTSQSPYWAPSIRGSPLSSERHVFMALHLSKEKDLPLSFKSISKVRLSKKEANLFPKLCR